MGVGIGRERPELAPSRKKIEPVWLNVGDLQEEYEGWYFAIKPTMTVKKFTEVMSPLLQIVRQSGKNIRKKASLDEVEDFVTDFSDKIITLCQGLSDIVIDWNFIDEDTEEPLAKPYRNAPLIASLEMSLIISMATLITGYMEGVDPNSLKPISPNIPSEKKETERMGEF